MIVTSIIRNRNTTVLKALAASFQGRETTRRTFCTSLKLLSASRTQTYGLGSDGGCFWPPALTAMRLAVALVCCFSQSGRAQISQEIDLRIEIEPSLYSSTLCQKLVALHSDRKLAPWGMTFARPSRLCTYPGLVSKAYSINMWRMVVSESFNGLLFSMCRPVRRQGVLREDCAWNVSLEKPRNWREKIVSDEFLFLVVAGLHEQLPVRDFNKRGVNLSRPEPRLKSERLENPPQMVRGRLNFESATGRMLFFPLTRPADVQAHSDTAFWWFQSESRTPRLAAFEELLKDEGYALLKEIPIPPAVPAKPQPLPPLAAPQHSPPKPLVSAPLDDAPHSKKAETPREPSWQDSFWMGIWTSRATVAGLSVPAAMSSRLSSNVTAQFDARHPLWESISTGVAVGYTRESERADLRVNTSLNGETQSALGRRETLRLAGQLNYFFRCSSLVCRVGANAGFMQMDTSWSYDRERTTLKVWEPEGRGTFVEPWFEIEPGEGQAEGAAGMISVVSHRIADAELTNLTAEMGWIWRPDWALGDLGIIKVAGWQALLGYKGGVITKSGQRQSDEIGTELLLNTFWFGIRAHFDEVLD
jgi:hypothetical protein